MYNIAQECINSLNKHTDAQHHKCNKDPSAVYCTNVWSAAFYTAESETWSLQAKLDAFDRCSSYHEWPHQQCSSLTSVMTPSGYSALSSTCLHLFSTQLLLEEPCSMNYSACSAKGLECIRKAKVSLAAHSWVWPATCLTFNLSTSLYFVSKHALDCTVLRRFVKTAMLQPGITVMVRPQLLQDLYMTNYFAIK